MTHAKVPTSIRAEDSKLHGIGSDEQNETSAPVYSLLERRAFNGALGQGQTENDHTGDFLVRVTSVRKRLLDDDNLCEKFVVDSLRYAGVIPKDSPATTRIETRQRKAEEGEDEHTLVQIFTRADPEQPSLL